MFWKQILEVTFKFCIIDSFLRCVASPFHSFVTTFKFCIILWSPQWFWLAQGLVCGYSYAAFPCIPWPLSIFLPVYHACR